MTPAVQYDTARFSESDAAELVLATLSCQRCLCDPTSIVIVGEDYGYHALCRCGACGTTTQIALDDGQALRLLISPPPDVPVGYVPYCGS